MQIYSPNNIEVLLHCHTTPTRHERHDTPAVQEAIGEFLDIGAIELDPESNGRGVYRTTPLGKAWVEALCRVETPKQVFVDEQGRIL